MLKKFIRILKSWNGIIAIIVLILILAVSFLIYKFMNRSKVTEQDIEIGLAPIKIMQTIDGVDKEINFTETAINIISNSANSEKTSFRDEAKKGIENAQISKILFPIIPQNKLNIIYRTSNPQLAIEKYLYEVYNLFKDNNIQPNIVQLEAEALNLKTDNILSLIRTNAILYKSMFYIEVPSTVIDLHLNYIRVIQVQNSFLLNLLSADKDPVKLQINSTMTLKLLSELNIAIKENLKTLQENYNITYKE